MKNSQDIYDHVSEDGHPSEAAIEFRRAAIRMNVVREISADALDLAIAYAWIGKAISRTKSAAKWQIQGIDPNTYEFILAIASDTTLRETGIYDALTSEPARGRKSEIDFIRSLCGFQNAIASLKRSISGVANPKELSRMGELCFIAEKMLSRKKIKPRPISVDNVVIFPTNNTKRMGKTD